MKRSNIDAMICRQEKITDITRETINKIQLDKLNAVLKREKERQGFYNFLWPDLVSLFIREAGLWLPCRFQVLLDWEN